MSSSATDAGTHGVQLWIALHTKAKILDCVPASPRLLLVTVRVKNIVIIIAVVHAPINGDTLAADFFNDLSVIIHKQKVKFPDAYVTVLADFNARVGSVTSDQIGAYGSEEENSNGEHLRAFLLEHNLGALNTLSEGASGYTWTGSRGHLHRIDYVLWPLNLLYLVQDVHVNREIELADFERDDHNLVDFRVTLDNRKQGTAVQLDSETNTRPSKLCKHKLADPGRQQQFVEWMWTFRPDTNTSIDKHLREAQEHIRSGARLFHKERKEPRKSWISQRTWNLMCRKDTLKKSLRASWAGARLASIRLCFLSWLAIRPAVFLKHHGFGQLLEASVAEASSFRSWASSSKLYNDAARIVRSTVKEDKVAFLDALAAQANQAAERGDNGAIYQLAKRAAGVKNRVLKVVEWEDGSLTSSAKEYSQRFQDHFLTVFGAKIVQNLNEIGVSQSIKPLVERLPTPLMPAIEKAFQALPSNKAVGPDSIPAELLKIALKPCAALLHDLLDKVWNQVYWPLEWRGGRLQELHKKDSTRVCDNFRGLLISDHLGKAASSVLYDPIDVPYHSYVPQTQCGAVKRKSGDLATHFLRTMMDMATACSLSVVILFIDLVKAFDRVLREIVIGWPQSGADDGVQYLMGLGFSRDHATDLAKEIGAGTVLDDIKVHPHVTALLASMHTGSWFSVADSSEVLVVGKGGRQGCRFGGVLFNLAYAKALRRLYARACEENIPIMLNYEPGVAPRTSPSSTSNGDDAHRVIVFDVTFVDDEAIVITASVPATLITKFRRAVELLIEVFEYYGMSINWKPGKTEAILVLRGKNAKAEKSRIQTSENQCYFDVSPNSEENVRIHIVPQYKHLGSIITASGSLVPEARQRVKSAMHAFAPLVKHIFNSTRIGTQRRARIGWSLVASRLFFNVHVWSKFEGKARSIINVMYMRLWRRICGDPRFQKTNWTDREVRTWLAVPSVDCYVRQRRLLYLSRLARTQFDAECMPWISLIARDIAVLRDNVGGKLDELPSPHVSLESYWQIAKEYPQAWKAIVNTYFTVDDDTVHKPASRGDGARTEGSFACELCGATWESHRKLAAHQWAKHKVKCDVRSFIGNVTMCAVCGTDFHTRARLVKHLLERRVRSKSRGVSCQAAFMASNPTRVPVDLLSRLEESDAAQHKSNRLAGHTNVIAGRPCKRTQCSILLQTARKRCLPSEEISHPPKRRRIFRKMPPPPGFVQLRVVERRGQRARR